MYIDFEKMNILVKVNSELYYYGLYTFKRNRDNPATNNVWLIYRNDELIDSAKNLNLAKINADFHKVSHS